MGVPSSCLRFRFASGPGDGTFPEMKRSLLAILFFSSFWLLQPALAAPTVVVKTDRPEALYQPNEEVTFTITAQEGGQPVDSGAISWSLSLDGYKIFSTGTGTVAKGSLEKPGFLLLTATCSLTGEKPIIAFGGAGVSPASLQPSLPVPDDFDQFWKDQKAKLAAIPMTITSNPTVIPTKTDANLEAFDIQLSTGDASAPVSGYLAAPKNALPKSLPAVLWVHGAGVRSSNLAAALNGARDGFLSMDINAHGIPNGKPEAFYKELASGKLKTYRSDGNQSRDTIYFRGMFLRLVRALDYLTKRPEWDGKTLAVIGHSQGGYQALVAGGLDPRVTFIGAGVAAGCDHSGMKADRISGWPKIVPILPDGSPDPLALEASRYFDAVNFATRCKAQAIMSVGFIDRTCPPTSVYTAYNVLQGLKEMIHSPTLGHTTTTEISGAFRKALLSHIAAKSLAPAALVN
jgi:cephalosporin-C deacetylase